MTPEEYINLQAQIARQTPEQQDYYTAAAGYTAQADAMQPAVDAAQIAVDDAQAALDAAIAAGEDPTPYQEALAVAQADLNALVTQQSGYTSQAQQATQQGDTLGASIAECQTLIDNDPLPPTPGQQAAAQAALVAYLLFLRKEAVAGAVQQNPVLVADLPSAVGHMGLRAFVSNATSDNFAATVVGGGTRKVPVYSDGTIWRVG